MIHAPGFKQYAPREIRAADGRALDGLYERQRRQVRKGIERAQVPG